jgi:hypothetical protein
MAFSGGLRWRRKARYHGIQCFGGRKRVDGGIEGWKIDGASPARVCRWLWRLKAPQFERAEEPAANGAHGHPASRWGALAGKECGKHRKCGVLQKSDERSVVLL